MYALPASEELDEDLGIPGSVVQWIVKLKDGLHKEWCENLARLIEEHINRNKVSRREQINAKDSSLPNFLASLDPR